MMKENPLVSAMAREGLLAGLVLAVTKHLRSLEKPWSKLPETTQKTVINEIREDLQEHVYDAVDLIASDYRTCFRAKVDQVTFKGGVKAVLLMGNDEASHELADAEGGTVLVVIEDPARYAVDASLPKADGNQRDLII
jgi:hypothetical protein